MSNIMKHDNMRKNSWLYAVALCLGQASQKGIDPKTGKIKKKLHGRYQLLDEYRNLLGLFWEGRGADAS